MAKGDNSRLTRQFSSAYIEKVFVTWQLHNKPNLTTLIELLEPDEYGRLPEPITVASWRQKYNWEGRDAEIQTRVQENTDRELVKIRMDMMKRHAERARQIGEMAFDYLEKVGFDSSASAVSAAFKAFAEEKQSTGMEVALTQVFTMSDSDLQKAMNRLLARASDLESEDSITGESEVIDDAISSQESTDD